MIKQIISKIVLIVEQNICDTILISTLTFQQIYQKFMQPEKVVEKANNPDQADKKDRKKHEDKKIKHERPAQYQRNADLITVDTVLQPLPKKNQILARPNLKDYQQKQAKNKQRITKLFEKKKQLYNEKFKPSKPLQKGEGGKHDDFNQQIEEFKELKERFTEVKNQRNAKRDELTKLIEQAKQNNAAIKKFKEDSKNSKEHYEQQIQKFQHRLITSQLSKQEQKNLNNEIMVLKRKIKDAEQVGNIQVRIDKAEQRKQELDAQIERAKAQKQPLQQQFKELKQQMDSKNEAINKIKGQMKNEKQQKTEAKQRNDKQYEQWKENKKKKLNDFSDKVKAIDEQNKAIWKEYHLKNEAYWEQKHKLDFLEWQHKVKQRKIRDIERQKRKAFAIEKQKTREKQEQLKKYIKQIQTCTFLTNYLKDILTETNKEQKTQEQKAQQPKDINAKIGEDAQWKKEKGLVVLQSKKSKEDEEPVKKGGKKNKKKNDKAEQTTAKKFQVPFNIQVLFDTLKLLPPESLEEVERKIGQLKERQALFERACSEEVNEADKQQIQKIKGGDKKEKKQKVVEQKKTEDDFPTL